MFRIPGLTLLFVAVLAGSALAAPDTVGFTGRFADDAEIAIFGQDFGAAPGAVYLGDAAAWDRCTVRQPLATSQWGPTLVTATVKLPGDWAQAPCYLFIVGDDGLAGAGLGPLIGGIGFAGPGTPGRPVVTDATAVPAPPTPRTPQVTAIYGEIADGGVIVVEGVNFARDAGHKAAAPDAPAPMVMLGDAPNYPDCSVLVEAPVRDWSPRRITAALALPVAAAGSDFYVFVRDANGAAGSGYAVTVADEGPGQPGRPTRLD